MVAKPIFGAPKAVRDTAHRPLNRVLTIGVYLRSSAVCFFFVLFVTLWWTFLRVLSAISPRASPCAICKKFPDVGQLIAASARKIKALPEIRPHRIQGP